jgi:hypothetical protein
VRRFNATVAYVTSRSSVTWGIPGIPIVVFYNVAMLDGFDRTGASQETRKENSMARTKTTRKTANTRTTKHHVVKNQVKEYAGAPIPTVKAYRRQMNEFKNTTAHCWLVIGPETYTTLNTYKDGYLPASYDPKHYTYRLTDKSRKLIDKKLESQGYEEVEPDQWPTFLTGAARKRAKYDMTGQSLDALLTGKAKVKAV